MKHEKLLSLKTLTKNNVWDIQENDVMRLLESAQKDVDLKDNMRCYLDNIRTAFTIEEIKIDKPEVIKKYENNGYKVGAIKMEDGIKTKWAIKKRLIMRVTDLTYENISHISASHLIEVLERNFGGGWDSLPQSIQDIICSGFDISTTTLPKDRLHNQGGMYDKKVKDGYDVLEIPKGAWVEAIFAKQKPMTTKPKPKFEEEQILGDIDDNDDNDDETRNNLVDNIDDNDDDLDDDTLTEESYRTTFESDPEELNIEAEDMSDEDSTY